MEAVEALEAKTDDELFVMLGSEVDDSSRMIPPTRRQLVQAAKDWMNTNREKLSQVICSSERVQAYYQEDSKTRRRATLVLAVGDAIGAIFGAIPVLVVAELLTREGIEEMCKTDWA